MEIDGTVREGDWTDGDITVSEVVYCSLSKELDTSYSLQLTFAHTHPTFPLAPSFSVLFVNFFVPSEHMLFHRGRA